MNGCTNPSAVNYDPGATRDDGSCIYLEKYNGVCYTFQDVEEDKVIDKSFTLSFSLEGGDWVFFHDYIPDFYLSTREKLYSLKDRKIYRHNEGAPGVYYDGTPRSFFIDAVFRGDQQVILNSIQWITEMLNQGVEKEFHTLTHITIWNAQQCTGRIALSDIYEDLEYERRKLNSMWSLSSFRDMVKEQGEGFLKDILGNFAVDPDKIDMEKPWFDQDLLYGDWFCIRFEFDNSTGERCILHGGDVNASKDYR